MLAGCLPFAAETPVALLLKHMQADPPSVLTKAPDLPDGVDLVLLQALAKSPDNRFATAGRLAAALAEAIGARP
jgi:serine/threonine-protein kinase